MAAQAAIHETIDQPLFFLWADFRCDRRVLKLEWMAASAAMTLKRAAVAALAIITVKTARRSSRA
ncbi:MAG: hypothetical protein WC026_13705 [Hyphomicrobium sp.]|uniref:hypothetical protein n=1 Tax=Hyphomicrobium sp. TaxID=82 RepID=UPI0035690BDE